MENQEFFKKEHVLDLLNWVLDKVEKQFDDLPSDFSDKYVGDIVENWAHRNGVVPTTFSGDEAIEILRNEGFCIPNKDRLWHVEEIMERLNCDNVEASWLGTQAIESENACEAIWDAIHKLNEGDDDTDEDDED